MSRRTINCGFVPLVDSAALVIARELSFAADEGLDLNLLRQPSWSALRDLLALGHLEAAQMLSPMPVAMSLGLGGIPAAVDALMVISVNGNVIGVSNDLAHGMRAAGWSGAFQAPKDTSAMLAAAADGPIRFGVPFPFSMHHELVSYWLRHRDDVTLDIRTVPPPMMADAIEEGEIDAFCVGEPWGSIAIERRVGELILPGAAIWAFAPEKVLGARRDWIEANPELTAALMRAVYRASHWLSDPGNRQLAGEILERSEHLGLPGEIIDRALAGLLITRPRSMAEHVPGFLRFHRSAANFPWRSQAAWIGNAIARRHGLDPGGAMQTARACFRADLYRQNLAPLGVDMPGASAKLEGALVREEAVASSGGQMILGPDAFFDGAVFDPEPV